MDDVPEPPPAGWPPPGQAFPGSATPGPPIPGQIVNRPAPATCYRHPDRPATLACSRCGRPICGECMVPAPVGQLCPDDARQRTKVRQAPWATAPLVTWAILAVNGALLLIEALVARNWAGLINPDQQQFAVAMCKLGALNAPDVAAGQYWRLVSAIGLHAGLLHFAVNGYALFIFGPALERYLGRLRYLALYLGAGLCASATSFAFNHTLLGVGASGAIFGVIGALLVFFWRRRNRGGQAALRQLVIVLVINAFITLGVPFVDKFDHLGGLLGGVAGMAALEYVAAHWRGARRSALAWGALAIPYLAAIVLVVYGGTAALGPALPNCGLGPG